MVETEVHYFCLALSLLGDSVVELEFRGDSVVDFAFRGDSVVDFSFRGDSVSAFSFRGDTLCSFAWRSFSLFGLSGFEPPAGAAKADAQVTVSRATISLVFIRHPWVELWNARTSQSGVIPCVTAAKNEFPVAYVSGLQVTRSPVPALIGRSHRQQTPRESLISLNLSGRSPAPHDVDFPC